MSGGPPLTKRIDYSNLNSITLCHSRYKKLHRSERQALLQCLVISQALITLSSHHWGKYSEFNSFLLDLFQSLPPSELSVPRTECSNPLCLTKCTQTITKSLGVIATRTAHPGHAYTISVTHLLNTPAKACTACLRPLVC